MQAVNCMNGFVVDSVKYSCKVSRSLEQLFQSQQNKSFPSQHFQQPLPQHQYQQQQQPFIHDSQMSPLFHQSSRERERESSTSTDFSSFSFERTPSATSRVLQLTSNQSEKQSSPFPYSTPNSYNPESQKFF